MNSWPNIALAALIVALVSPPIHGSPRDHSDSPLDSARGLYAAAEYEEALELLNALAAERSETSAGTVAEYRAYCLLALGRIAEAEQAIAVVVTADPLYQASGADVSPRIRTAFAEVRRRMLPAIILRQYGTAKTMFDAKDFAAARDGFGRVLAALSDRDIAAAASEAPLSDLQLLASGFHDLSASAVVPPPLEARAHPIDMTPRVQIARIYNANDGNVTPPTALHQGLPSFVTHGGEVPRVGSLEVVIDERGAVESAAMRTSVSPRYDAQVIAAAREWSYGPAILDGAPVRYRKVIQVLVQAK